MRKVLLGAAAAVLATSTSLIGAGGSAAAFEKSHLLPVGTPSTNFTADACIPLAALWLDIAKGDWVAAYGKPLDKVATLITNDDSIGPDDIREKLVGKLVEHVQNHNTDGALAAIRLLKEVVICR